MGYCGKALELDPACAKARLRRARAHMGRHEYEAAAADLDAVRAADPLSMEAAEAAAALERARAAHRRKQQATFAHMFERGRLVPDAPPAAAVAGTHLGGAAAS